MQTQIHSTHTYANTTCIRTDTDAHIVHRYVQTETQMQIQNMHAHTHTYTH